LANLTRRTFMTDKNDDRPEFRDELRMLGRGIGRTMIGDAKAIAIGAAIGAALGLTLALIGLVSFRFRLVGGALVGGIAGLLGHGLLRPAFEFDQRDRDRN
jgi:phage terminase large subunit-like protein